MKRSSSMIAGAAVLLLAVAVACGPDVDWRAEWSRVTAPLFVNGGFEAGAGSLGGWTVTTYQNSTGLAAVPPTSFAQLNLANGGFVATFPRTNATPESQPFMGMVDAAGVPHWPKFGTTSAVVNESTGMNSTNANSLKQSYTVTYADVDPSDGKVHVRFVLAPALQAAGHIPAQQPYFYVELRNLTTASTMFTDFNYANNPGVPWRSQGTGPAAVLYTDWVINDIAPGNAALRVGDTIELEVIASRCQQTGHFGEVYVDGFGSNFPGLSVRKTAPQFANVDSDITYDFTVQNNTTGVAPNVVVDETLPLGTTFVSATTSTPGASCTTPPVGGTGVVSCSFGFMNPGAVGRFQVTVRAFPTAPNGSGTASAATANTLTDATKTWTANAFAGWTAYLVGGQGVGQTRVIRLNTANQLTVTPNWTVNPNTTTAYKIVDPPQETGTVSGRTANTLVDGTKNWTVNQWVASTVTILTGGGAGQQRTIISNDDIQLTVDANWAPQPGVGATFAIGLPPNRVVNGNYTVRGDTISPLLGPKAETLITAGVQYTDLAITVSDGVPAVNWGSPIQYTLTVTNQGPLAANGATVTDNFPALLTGVTWTCTTSAGGSCGAGSGNGNINTTVNLPPGATATFTINATVVAGTGTGTLTDVASVAAPAGLTDLDTRNNSDGDTDQIGALFALTVNKDPADTGQGTVTSSPLAISCGTACASANASFATGTVVTLTAVARPGDAFTGWGGACSGTALTCDVTMDAVKSVVCHFRGPSITGTAGPGGTISCVPPEVSQGGNSTCTITPGADYVILAVTDNGTTVTGSVSGGAYTLGTITIDHTVAVTFNHRPDFTSTGPTAAGEGVPFTYNPTVTDPDGPGPLTYSADPADTCGGTINGSSGSYAFTPGAGAPATCVMAIQVCDAAGACRSQQTVVTINHLPIAVNDTASTTGPLTIPGGTLTANDSPGTPPSESSQTLTVTGVSATSSQGGTVTLVGGVVTYTPPAGFTGTDTFTYTVTDSGNPALTATATVTVTVTMNAPPSFISTGPSAAGEGVPYTYNPVVTDPGGPGPITYSVDLADTCGGSVNGSSGSYTFTPGSGAPATCVMAIQACDALGACTTQQTTITINHLPVAVNDNASATGPITIPGGTLTANDSPGGPPSEAGQTLTVTGVSASSSQGGTVTLAGGVVTYTPPAGFVGTDTFTYTVTDSGNPALTATATVTVVVTMNAPPGFISTGPTAAGEGVPFTYNPVVTDPDGPGPITYSTGPGDTCGGSVNGSSGSYTFTPGSGAPATCVMSVQACDAAGACSSQQTTVTINHQPVAMNDTANATGPITIPGGTLTANDSPGTPPSESSQTLTITGVSATSSQGGTVSLAGGVVTYTPPAGFTGTDTFTYTVTDSGNPALTATATVTVTVTAPANAPPVISSTPAATAPEGSPYVYDATATDPDGPGATWSVGAGDTCGGTIDPATGHYTFTPGAATPSPCTLAVQVCDGGSPNQCATQATQVTITRPSGDAGFGDGLGVSGSGCGCSSGAALASLPWYGIPALLVLARRRRRRSGAGLRPG